MGLKMSSQIGAVSKSPVTMRAGEWTLAWREKKKMLYVKNTIKYLLSANKARLYRNE